MALRRQALAEWRDRQILELCRLLNDHAQHARTAFEAELHDAGLIDSVWDPARFADARIDRLLTATVRQALRQFLSQAADELAATHCSFAPFADALRKSEGFGFPQVSLEEGSGPGTPEAVGMLPVNSGDPPRGRRLYQLAGRAKGAGKQATSALAKAGRRAGTIFQDRSGLHGRLRAAAVSRVGTQWMGSRGEPRPVLAQVISIIDDVAAEARMSTI